MSDEMRVRHLGNDRFAIDIRGHILAVDHPVPGGGEDSAPTVTPEEVHPAPALV